MLHKHLLGGVTGVMIMKEGSANQQDKGCEAGRTGSSLR